MSKKFIIGVGLVFTVVVLIFGKNILVNIKSQNKTADLLTNSSEVKFENNLSDTVKKICSSVEKNDIEDLKSFVTEVPDIYIQKSRESMRKYLKMDKNTFQETTRKKPNTYTVSPYPISSNKKELVYNAIPAISLIQEQKLKLVKIVTLKQNENEAKASVSFSNDESNSTDYEILLIRTDDKWKVFSFTYPDRWSNIYAEKTQE